MWILCQIKCKFQVVICYFPTNVKILDSLLVGGAVEKTLTVSL